MRKQRHSYTKPETWNFQRRALIVWQHFQDYYDYGIRFVGDKVYPCSKKELVKSWGIPEIQRLYNMIQQYQDLTNA